MKGKERGGAGWRVGRGLSAGGAEGCCLWLAEEEEPFRLGGKVHGRTSWAEQALREGLLRRAQKAWAEGISDHLPFRLRKSVRFWRMLKLNVPTSGQPAVLIV